MKRAIIVGLALYSLTAFAAEPDTPEEDPLNEALEAIRQAVESTSGSAEETAEAVGILSNALLAAAQESGRSDRGQDNAQLYLPIQSYIDGLANAGYQGSTNTLGILSFLIALILASVTLGGLGLYRRLYSALNATILEEIRESDARSLVSLGVESYNGHKLIDFPPDPMTKATSIASAIAHTGHAYEQAGKLSKNNELRTGIIAGSVMNLAYYYVELALLKESAPSADNPHLKTARGLLRSEYNNVVRFINSKALEPTQWFRVSDSKLFVEFHSCASAEGCQQVLKNVRTLLADNDVPPSWREKRMKFWEALEQNHGLAAQKAEGEPEGSP